MGYNISLNDCRFFIKKENVKAATKALKEYALSRACESEKYAISKMRHLEDVLKEFCYYVEYDDDDNVNSISFEGEKLCDDLEMLDSIAEFVEKGSWIEIEGEEAALWRWYFDGQRCTQINPKILWPENLEWRK